MKRFSMILFIAIGLLALGGTAWADEAPVAPVDGEPEVKAPIYGMQMWVDQETGDLRAPTREEAAYFSGLIRKMFAGKATQPQPRPLKSGGLAVELGESMMEFSVVRITEDGTLERGCVDDADQALAFVHNTVETAREEQ